MKSDKEIFEKYRKDDMWYELTYELMGDKWLKDIFSNLDDEFKFSEVYREKSNAEKFVFMSFAANKGKYEKELFKFICDKKIYNKFLVSDGNEEIKDHEQDESCEYGEFSYKLGVNCKNISNNDIKADIIMDFKGALWYCFEQDQTREIIQILQNYNDCLKPNGIIIIDNIEINKLKSCFQSCIHEICLKFPFFKEKKIENFMEDSTGYFYEKNINKTAYKDVKKFIEEHFHIQKRFKDRMSTIILKKR